MNFEYASDDTILQELGQRIARHRLNKNITQDKLAKEAGVSKQTIHRIEHGSSVQASNLIRVLRTLKLIGNMDVLVPNPPASPIQKLMLQGKTRQRASLNKQNSKKSGRWVWGDEL